jgi:hypothetical protein
VVKNEIETNVRIAALLIFNRKQIKVGNVAAI